MNKPFIENKIIFVWKYKEKRRSVSYYSLLGIWKIYKLSCKPLIFVYLYMQNIVRS